MRGRTAPVNIHVKAELPTYRDEKVLVFMAARALISASALWPYVPYALPIFLQRHRLKKI